MSYTPEFIIETLAEALAEKLEVVRVKSAITGLTPDITYDRVLLADKVVGEIFASKIRPYEPLDVFAINDAGWFERVGEDHPNLDDDYKAKALISEALARQLLSGLLDLEGATA